MLFPGLIKVVDKDILTKATLDGLKLLKLLHQVNDSSPNLRKVVELLHCLSHSNSPHVNGFRSLYKEAKIQVWFIKHVTICMNAWYMYI